MLPRSAGALAIPLLVAATVGVPAPAPAEVEPGLAAGVTPGLGVGARASGSAVVTETQLRRAWADPLTTRIDLVDDITLRNCHLGDPMRESPYPLVLDGHGHTIRQSCFEKRVLRQDGTGWLDIRDVTLTRGGSDGPGAALTSRGEILLSDCVIKQNLAEEPGGGVFSMRRVTAHRCYISGNLANDDGGGIYARRGGVQVYDSVLSTNLVDGSGGAIGSTGDILVVDSRVDGNTTDGDGGSLYTDEDGDVTVIHSLIDGSAADGPGGAIFTLDGDVAVFDSTLIGNRADDRGGAIAGEADVLVVNSTLARNLAIAHAGGAIWARGNLAMINATVVNNYAEGEGGGSLSAGTTYLLHSTMTRNIASVGGNIGSSGPLTSFASIVGPPAWEGVTGDTIPTRRSCRVYSGTSLGYNFIPDPSCDLVSDTDVEGDDPQLTQLEDDPNGFVLSPFDDSQVRSRIPSDACLGVLPDRLPAGQLLEAWVDWDEVMTHDATGTRRGDGHPCDVGAVQSEPLGNAGRAAPDDIRPHVPALGPPAPPAVATTPAGRAKPSAGGPVGLRAALDSLEVRLHRFEQMASRFDVLLGCTDRVGVDRVGDRESRWGFRYDERDGTGLDLRPALVLHAGRSDARWDVLKLSTKRRCLSVASDPNGAGDDARPGPTALLGRPRDVKALLRTLHRLERLEDKVENHTERFDEWESCLAWLPLTEAGDLDQGFGYLADQGPPPYERVSYPALDIDHSEWDDPDYQVLAFRGKDHPFLQDECGTDPGEAPDRALVRDGSGSALTEVRQGIRALREGVEDLAEPVDEISRFDQCLYTVGIASHPGYLFRDRAGTETRRSALSFDMRGAHLPEMSVMAFPGEEPPQIECNEDAGGVQTHE